MKTKLIPVIVKTTASEKDDLVRIAALLVERELAACVNIGGPIQSVYRWQGKIEQSTEWTAEIKTDRGLVAEVAKEIKDNHPYEVPPVIVQSFEIACPEFETWMQENIKQQGP